MHQSLLKTHVSECSTHCSTAALLHRTWMRVMIPPKGKFSTVMSSPHSNRHYSDSLPRNRCQPLSDHFRLRLASIVLPFPQNLTPFSFHFVGDLRGLLPSSLHCLQDFPRKPNYTQFRQFYCEDLLTSIPPTPRYIHPSTLATTRLLLPSLRIPLPHTKID